MALNTIIGGELILDTMGARESINAVKKDLKFLQSEIGTITKEMTVHGKTVDGLTDKLDRLKTEEKMLTAEIAKLTKELEESEASGKKSVAELQNLQIQINGFTNKLYTCQQKLKITTKEMDDLNSRGISSTKFFEIFKNVLTDINPTLGKLVSGLGGAKLAFGTLATAAGVATVKAVKQGVQAFIEYEDAFAGIRKTINGTETDFENINAEIQSLSREIPKTASQIAEMAKLGGQLGIASDDVVDFAEVVLRLADTTNVVAESAGEMIAQIGAITGLDSSDYERFGSTLVALGNSASATEKEILDMSNRIARFSQSAKLSNQEILALATALTSMGIEAEAGGTSLQKMFAKLTLAVETESEALDGFADVAGMSAEEFSKLYKQSSIKGLQALLKGMNDLDETSQSYTKTLADLDITEVRLSSVLQALASNQDGLTSALDLSQKAWVENSELARSSGEVYDTLSSDIQVAKNNFTELSRNIGSLFAPAISTVVTKAGDLAAGINNIVNPLNQSTLAIDNSKDAISNYATAMESATEKLDTFAKSNLKMSMAQSLSEAQGAWERLNSEIKKSEANQESMMNTTARAGENITNVTKAYINAVSKQSGRVIKTLEEARAVHAELKNAQGTNWGNADALWDKLAKKQADYNAEAQKSAEYEEERTQLINIWAEALNEGYVTAQELNMLDFDFSQTIQDAAAGLRAEAEAQELITSAVSETNEILAEYKKQLNDGNYTQDQYITNLKTMQTEYEQARNQVQKGTTEYNVYTAQLNAVATALNAITEAQGQVKLTETEKEIEELQEELDGLNSQLLTAMDALSKDPGNATLSEWVKDLNDAITTKQLKIFTAQLKELITTNGDPDKILEIANKINALTEATKGYTAPDDFADDLISTINSYGTAYEKADLKVQQLTASQADWQAQLDKATDPAIQATLQKIVDLYDDAITSAEEARDTLNAPLDATSWINTYGSEAQKLQLEIDKITDSIADMQAELEKEGVDTDLIKNLMEQAEAKKADLLNQMEHLGEEAAKSFVDALVPDVDWSKWNAEEWGNYFRDSFLDAVGQIGDALTNLLDTAYEADIEAKKGEIEALEEQLDGTLERLESQSDEAKDRLQAQYQEGYITELEYYRKSQQQQAQHEKAKQKAEAETAKKKEELLKQQQAIEEKQFNANKANSIAQVLIDSATSIIKAWTQGPVVGATSSALIGTLAGLQIAQINAQKYVPALAQGGITTGPTMALIGDNSSGREAVLPLEQSTMRLLASEILKGMHSQGNTVYNNSSQADDNRSYTINQNITTPRGMTRREAYLQARRALRETK